MSVTYPQENKCDAQCSISKFFSLLEEGAQKWEEEEKDEITE